MVDVLLRKGVERALQNVARWRSDASKNIRSADAPSTTDFFSMIDISVVACEIYRLEFTHRYPCFCCKYSAPMLFCCDLILTPLYPNSYIGQAYWRISRWEEHDLHYSPTKFFCTNHMNQLQTVLREFKIIETAELANSNSFTLYEGPLPPFWSRSLTNQQRRFVKFLMTDMKLLLPDIISIILSYCNVDLSTNEIF